MSNLRLPLATCCAGHAIQGTPCPSYTLMTWTLCGYLSSTTSRIPSVLVLDHSGVHVYAVGAGLRTPLKSANDKVLSFARVRFGQGRGARPGKGPCRAAPKGGGGGGLQRRFKRGYQRLEERLIGKFWRLWLKVSCAKTEGGCGTDRPRDAGGGRRVTPPSSRSQGSRMHLILHFQIAVGRVHLRVAGVHNDARGVRRLQVLGLGVVQVPEQTLVLG